jgi:hypothetical protein
MTRAKEDISSVVKLKDLLSTVLSKSLATQDCEEQISACLPYLYLHLCSARRSIMYLLCAYHNPIAVRTAPTAPMTMPAISGFDSEPLDFDGELLAPGKFMGPLQA